MESRFDFSKINPPIIEIPGPWYRVHPTDKRVVYFGRSGTNRWDSPDKSYGVMYAGESWQGALMESVLHDPKTKVVLESELAKRSMALFTTATALRVIDLTDGVVLRALALTETETKGPYSVSQAISEGVYSAGWIVHGVRYASRLDPKLACLALFEFPEERIIVQGLGALLSDFNRSLVGSMLDTYRIRLIFDL